MSWSSWLTNNPVTRAAKKVADAAKETLGFAVDDVSNGGGSADEETEDIEPVVVFIRERKSSMFFDADGDLGHEFYEETVGGLRRVLEGLVPQGLIPLECPAISPHVRAVILPNHTLA